MSPCNLWVDDSRPAPAGWVHAHNVEEALVYLMLRQVQRMSIDCDLDCPECPQCNFACGHREGICLKNCTCHQNGRLSGLDLVRTMAERNLWPKEKPEVHSANPEGGEQMKQVIEAYFS